MKWSEENVYLMCPYCGVLFSFAQAHETKLEQSHIKNCTGTYDPAVGITNCYSCGKTDGSYTNSQIAKEHKARCKECIGSDNKNRFGQWDYLATGGPWEPEPNPHKPPNHKLTHWVSEGKVDQVHKQLELGADPNYIRQDYVANHWPEYDIYIRSLHLFDANGNEIPEEDTEQPTTPLKLCIFSLSNCMNSEQDDMNYCKIAQLLIDYGAEKTHALEYYLYRYGNPYENVSLEEQDDNYKSNPYVILYEMLASE